MSSLRSGVNDHFTQQPVNIQVADKMINFLWDLRQQARIADAENATNANTRAVNAATENTRGMREAIERLTLITQAMWELLRERTELSEADLFAKVEEIDLRDGVADGRVVLQRQNCPSCERVNSGKRASCIYCGTEIAAPSVFNSVKL
jgi:spermidine/putrescine-binding protein